MTVALVSAFIFGPFVVAAAIHFAIKGLYKLFSSFFGVFP